MAEKLPQRIFLAVVFLFLLVSGQEDPDDIAAICIIGGGPAGIQLASMVSQSTNHTFKMFEQHDRKTFFLNSYIRNASRRRLNTLNNRILPDQLSLILPSVNNKKIKSFNSFSTDLYPMTHDYVSYLKYFRDHTIDNTGKQGKMYFNTQVVKNSIRSVYTDGSNDRKLKKIFKLKTRHRTEKGETSTLHLCRTVGMYSINQRTSTQTIFH